MKKTYHAPHSHGFNFHFEGTILSGSPINKYNQVKDEGEEQYSQQLNYPPKGPWSGMNEE